MRHTSSWLAEKNNAGFTLIEVLVVIFIIGILSAVSFSSFTSAEKDQALISDAAKIVSLFAEARSQSVANKNGSAHGVHIGTTKVIRFAGSTYRLNDSTNIEVSLSSGITISTSSPNGLAGNVSDVVFTRLSGTTSAFGTIKVRLAPPASSTKTIRIHPTGLAEIE